MKKALISYSAGIDSTTAAFLYRSYGYDVTLATFEDGGVNNPDSKYFDISKPIDKKPWLVELLEYQKRIGDKYGFNQEVFRFPELQQLTTIYGRKGNEKASFAESLGLNYYVGYKFLMASMLLSHGAAHNYKVVVFGHLPFDTFYKDELPESFDKIRELLINIYDRVDFPEIVNPFYAPEFRTKESVIKKAIKLGVPLEETYSCRVELPILQDGRYPHCGKCEMCLERLRAFQALGIKDPAPYVER